MEKFVLGDLKQARGDLDLVLIVVPALRLRFLHYCFRFSSVLCCAIIARSSCCHGHLLVAPLFASLLRKLFKTLSAINLAVVSLYHIICRISSVIATVLLCELAIKDLNPLGHV